jgi:hypothetical protein
MAAWVLALFGFCKLIKEDVNLWIGLDLYYGWEFIQEFKYQQHERKYQYWFDFQFDITIVWIGCFGLIIQSFQ